MLPAWRPWRLSRGACANQPPIASHTRFRAAVEGREYPITVMRLPPGTPQAARGRPWLGGGQRKQPVPVRLGHAGR
jgi:hypothetical protein